MCRDQLCVILIILTAFTDYWTGLDFLYLSVFKVYFFLLLRSVPCPSVFGNCIVYIESLCVLLKPKF